MNFVYDPTNDDPYETQILKDRIFKMRQWMYEEFSPKKSIPQSPLEQPSEVYEKSKSQLSSLFL
tara:strand:- start:1350 stop:1541 length:192 start_codon:yes stop_codon:yes gene_type:complete